MNIRSIKNYTKACVPPATLSGRHDSGFARESLHSPVTLTMLVKIHDNVARVSPFIRYPIERVFSTMVLHGPHEKFFVLDHVHSLPYCPHRFDLGTRKKLDTNHVMYERPKLMPN